MTRVIGIDPGTLTVDLCGLEHGRVFLDRSVPTAEALADPARFVALLAGAGPLDCIAGPSGYGLPLTPAQQATEEDLRLAFLAAEGEPGGIGGLRALARALGKSTLPVVFTPGVIHLPSVPAHRKVNRVDMGTADKVRAAAAGRCATCRCCCSSSGPRSRRRWPWPRDRSWTASGDRPGLWGFARPAGSTRKSPFSPGPYPSLCCSGAARRRSRGGTAGPGPPTRSAPPGRPGSRSPSTPSSRAP